MNLQVNIQKQLSDFSLTMEFEGMEGTLGLLGASGCGKSLTLKCIAGIETPDKGRIILNDRVLFDSEKGINVPIQKRRVGLLFQNYALFPHMTVRQNIEIGMQKRLDRKTRTEVIARLFHLEGLLDRYPGRLSGGEQQRVALARIMAQEPEVLMLDEPFSALDSYLKDNLQQELSEILQDYKGQILMVSHSRDELYRFCQSILVLHQGKIVERGTRTDIFCNPTQLITAKLTGCKNLSRAKKISEYEVAALDWNIILKTDQVVEEGVRYVGIRAHHIRPSMGKEENILPITLAEYSEGPFEHKLLFRIKSKEAESQKLWWIISKQEWSQQMISLPEFIALPKEHLLLLKEEQA